jgi:methylenetetrahydrofolate reductase (NADPH)
MSKHSISGCESCGQCRIADTLYICPETCPKGLTNGPCGGTRLDICEFDNRECIHSSKAGLAKAVNQTELLKKY